MSSSAEDAMERAIAIITAYCQAVDIDEDDDPDEMDEESGEALFDILYDLEEPLLEAVTDEEVEAARIAFSTTIIALASIINHLLDHCDTDLEKFDLIKGIAQEHYRSLA